MYTLQEIAELRRQTVHFQMQNREILDKYTDEELQEIYNGIGPTVFPEWLRDAISSLHPSLLAVALIHDVEWTEAIPGQFDASNTRFKANGYRVAAAKFAWYDPRRYIVCNRAERFAQLCQMFGASFYNARKD